MNELTKEQILTETNSDMTETPKVSCSFDVRKSSVFYETWYEAISRLPKKEQLKAYQYILEYSFYHIEPEDDKSLSYTIFIMAQPSIDSAQDRYDTATENGKKGGRPSVVNNETIEKVLQGRKEGKTQKQLAAEIGVSIRTIQRIEKATRQNHNVNVNVNVNDDINVNDNNATLNEANAFTTTSSKQQENKLSYKEKLEKYDKDIIIYKEKVQVMELFKQYIKPGEIAKQTGFNISFVNMCIDELKANKYEIPEEPRKPKNILSIPVIDGSTYDMDLDEFKPNFENNKEAKDLYDIFIDPKGTYKFEPKFTAKWFKENYGMEV